MTDEDRSRRNRTLRWAGVLVAIVVVALLGACGVLATLFWPTLADELYLERHKEFEPSGSFAYTETDLSARLEGLEFASPSTDSSIGEGIEVLTRLERLELSNTQVDDALGPALRRVPSLNYVDLSGTKVTDSIVDDLLALPNLNYVDLAGTAVSLEAAHRLNDEIVKRYPLNAGVSYDWPDAEEPSDAVDEALGADSE